MLTLLAPLPVLRGWYDLFSVSTERTQYQSLTVANHHNRQHRRPHNRHFRCLSHRQLDIRRPSKMWKMNGVSRSRWGLIRSKVGLREVKKKRRKMDVEQETMQDTQYNGEVPHSVGVLIKCSFSFTMQLVITNIIHTINTLEPDIKHSELSIYTKTNASKLAQQYDSVLSTLIDLHAGWLPERLPPFFLLTHVWLVTCWLLRDIWSTSGVVLWVH